MQAAGKDQLAVVHTQTTGADKNGPEGMTANCGLAVVPPSNCENMDVLMSSIVAPHCLDMTPSDPSHSCTISVRQLLYLLQQCGIVGKPIPGRSITHAAAVRAVQRACYPSQDLHALVRI